MRELIGSLIFIFGFAMFIFGIFDVYVIDKIKNRKGDD